MTKRGSFLFLWGTYTVDKSIRRSMTSPFKTVYFLIFVKITVAKLTSAMSQNFQS